MLTELYSLLEALGGNLFPCLFQLLEAFCILWLAVPFNNLQSQQQWAEFSYCITLTFSYVSGFHFKAPCAGIGPTWITQDTFPISR